MPMTEEEVMAFGLSVQRGRTYKQVGYVVSTSGKCRCKAFYFGNINKFDTFRARESAKIIAYLKTLWLTGKFTKMVDRASLIPPLPPGWEGKPDQQFKVWNADVDADFDKKLKEIELQELDTLVTRSQDSPIDKNMVIDDLLVLLRKYPSEGKTLGSILQFIESV